MSIHRKFRRILNASRPSSAAIRLRPDLLTAVVSIHGKQRLIDHVAEQFGVKREELANKLVPVFYELHYPEQMRHQ